MARYKRSEVFNQIMTEIYKMSIPSADWNELVEKYRDPDTGISEVPYWDFSIADWLLDDIIEKHLRKHHVSKGESELLRFQILLGPSPVSLRAGTPPRKDKTDGE